MGLQRIGYQPWHEPAYNRNRSRYLREPFHGGLAVKSGGYCQHSARIESAHEPRGDSYLLASIANVEDEQAVAADSENVPFHLHRLGSCAYVGAACHEPFAGQAAIVSPGSRFPRL